ncbi:pilus assembly protein [Rhodoblastus sp. 17X3]|uniref:TadE/TadG family type IV pilus assembly protein n=1 Tax=Rhodoblastus sp. 17X3 TaxID=3047026 RepID=UPI0024B6FBDD|nr:TadE/TadG family type IV pilus assembly protein [Rhodoblastus sp. 17X3]MDI9848851.1 pilus assembly protein [Rhodoblastus sp. 17X3]
MGAILRRLRKDEAGATMVEFAVAVLLVLTLIGGVIDFLLAFWQWNSAVKAAEIGARIAAVSNPVAAGINPSSYTVPVTTTTGQPISGSAFGAITCDGAAHTCSSGGYDATAMNWIVYGRGNASCVTAASVYSLGMCQVLSMLNPALSPANVMIEYSFTGLGYQGGVAAPTITLWLKNVKFHFFFLSGLLSFANITMPTVKYSITGEDISSSAPVN